MANTRHTLTPWIHTGKPDTHLPSVISPLLMSLYGSFSYSAGNSAFKALPTDTAPVAQPQLCHYAAPQHNGPLLLVDQKFILDKAM